MKLFCVSVTGVYPPQCVTVSDCETYATDLAAYLKKRVPAQAEFVDVVPVEDFFPMGFTDCDQTWNKLAVAFSR